MIIKVYLVITNWGFTTMNKKKSKTKNTTNNKAQHQEQ